MKYHVPVDGNDKLLGRLSVPTLCGRRVADVWLLWSEASDYVFSTHGCRRCLWIAGQKRQSHQGQEDHE